MTQVALQAQVTKTAAFDGAAVDISGLPAQDVTLKIHVSELTEGAKALLVVEDVAAADFSGGGRPILAYHFTGSFEAENDYVKSEAWYRIPMTRYGVATGKMRLRLQDISGTDASITYRAWLEY